MISFKASCGRTYGFNSYRELLTAIHQHPENFPESNEEIWEIRINGSLITADDQILRTGTDTFHFRDVIAYAKNLTDYKWKFGDTTEFSMSIEDANIIMCGIEGHKAVCLKLIGEAYEDLFPNYHPTGIDCVILTFDMENEDIETVAINDIVYPYLNEGVCAYHYKPTKNESDYFAEKLKIYLEKATAYLNSIDKDAYDFGCMVANDIPVLPVTVGLFSDSTIKSIEGCSLETDPITVYSRTVIAEHAMTMIFEKHGENGCMDQSLRDMDDIARIPYVLANYDQVICKPDRIIEFKKDIGERIYTILMAASDGERRNYVLDAYITALM